MFYRTFRAKIRFLLFFTAVMSLHLPAADETVLTLLATSDLHGNIAQIEQAVAPAVAAARKSDPEVIYLDAGDVAQGTFSASLNHGGGILPKLASAGCEIFVPGNHELEYGFEEFKKLVRSFPNTVLAANLHAPELKEAYKPWVILERKNVKIAFIGMMLKELNNAFPVEKERFNTLPYNAVLRREVNAVRAAGAEIIVLVLHAGKYSAGENLYEILSKFPGIDLVIGSHTHRADPGSRVGNAWYIQPPAHGKKMLKALIRFDKKLRRVNCIESSLLDLPYFPAFEPPEAYEKVDNKKHDKLDFPAHIIRDHLKSDWAIYAVGSRRKLTDLIRKKQPDKLDYYNVFPYCDRIITVPVSGGELQEIVREYLKFTHKRKMYLAVSGFSFSSSRGKLRHIRALDRQKVCTLAISTYAAAGAGGQLPGIRRILENKIDRTQLDNAPEIMHLLTGKNK